MAIKIIQEKTMNDMTLFEILSLIIPAFWIPVFMVFMWYLDKRQCRRKKEYENKIDQWAKYFTELLNIQKDTYTEVLKRDKLLDSYQKLIKNSVAHINKRDDLLKKYHKSLEEVAKQIAKINKL